jgi:RHS repeat-associated protein
MKEGGEYYYYHNDHLGTPKKLTDSSGQVVWSAVHEAFGEAHVDVATIENNLRFAGQYFDEETGLHYNFHRYYDPTTGRYTQTDPIGFAAGDSNLYRYAFNNSVNLYDPEGEIIPLVFLGAWAVVEVALSIYDIYETAKTLMDDCVSTEEKLAVTGLMLAGLVGPGGGYATAGKKAVKLGRSGKQARLRELVNDPKVSSVDRGWIKQELNQIKRGKRKTVRVPVGKELAHRRGFEAKKGYGYEYSDLQDIDIHKIQHKYEGY